MMSPRKSTTLATADETNLPLTVSQVAALCADPWGLEEYSPLLEHNYLLLDVAGEPPPAGEPLDAVIARLRQLPCPVIALGPLSSPALLAGVDVVVDNLQAARVLLQTINAHPLAAMTLVQLLRHNERVSPLQGLLAESLAYASLQVGAEFAGAAPTAALTALTRTQTPAPGESGPAVLLERCGDELHLLLNRPHQRNAYSVAMRDALYEGLQLLKMDGQLRRGVIRGAGGCFCIGGDLGEFGQAVNASFAHAIRSTRNVGSLLLELGPRLEFQLHRACIGAGIELPAFGGRVVANNNTFFQLPEIKFGLLPGAGGTVSILRRIGRHRTAWLALSARRINAATALQWGLIDEVSDPG